MRTLPGVSTSTAGREAGGIIRSLKCRVASRRVASRRVASRRVASHRVAPRRGLAKPIVPSVCRVPRARAPGVPPPASNTGDETWTPRLTSPWPTSLCTPCCRVRGPRRQGWWRQASRRPGARSAVFVGLREWKAGAREGRARARAGTRLGEALGMVSAVSRQWGSSVEEFPRRLGGSILVIGEARGEAAGESDQRNGRSAGASGGMPVRGSRHSTARRAWRRTTTCSPSFAPGGCVSVQALPFDQRLIPPKRTHGTLFCRQPL